MNISEHQREVWSKVVAKSWSDDDYKSRLIDAPREVLSEAGFQLPDDAEVTVTEQGAGAVHLVLPAKPEGDQAVSDKALESMSGGFTSCCCGPAWY